MANTYKDIPQGGDILATSQADIEHNFLYVANTLGTSSKSGDHQISVNGNDTASFEGRHLQVCLKNRHGAVPFISGVGGIGDSVDSLLYSDNGNVFFGSVTGSGAFQLTTYNSGANFGGHATITDGAGKTTNNAGWTFLPGGLILQYGFRVLTGSSPASGTATFPIGFPTACLVVTGNSNSSNTSTSSMSFFTITSTNFGFEMAGSSNPTGFNYIAIGY